MDGEPRPAGRGKGRGRWTPLLLLLLVGGSAAAVSLAPVHAACGFRVVTGAPCPGCGMTRACLALLRGDVAASFSLHPMAIPVALVAAAALALAVHEGATGRPTFRGLAERRAGTFAVVLLSSFALLWVVRVLWHPEWSPDPFLPGSPADRLLR